MRTLSFQANEFQKSLEGICARKPSVDVYKMAENVLDAKKLFQTQK